MHIPTTLALHSHMMEPLLEEFETIVGRFTLKEPQIPYISNVTGGWTSPREVCKPRYWATHLRETVRFSEGIKKLLEDSTAPLVEVGPGSELNALLTRYFDNENKRVINLVRPRARAVSDIYYLLNRIGRLWLMGVQVDWNR